MTRRSFAARLSRLEPKTVFDPAPNVLEVRPGETNAEALSRFRARWPHVRRDHRFMVVPAPVTPAEAQQQGEARRAERRSALGTLKTAKDATL
jgi:hypothetical protein